VLPQLDAGHTGRAHAEEDHLEILQPLPDHFGGAVESRKRHDCGAVLIVVEHGDVQLVLEASLDLEADRCRDVLQVDATEAGRDRLAHRDQFLDAGRAHANGIGVNVGELFEQHRLALHHGQGRLWTEVAEAEDRGAVGQHRHRVGLDRVIPHQLALLSYRGTDPTDPGCVGHRKIVTSEHRKLRRHLDLASPVPIEDPVRD
jgi:hypothetical protein